MLTRGHLIGEIIDDLSALSDQASVRNKVGLTDLSVHSENFFRDVLNVLLDLDLKNLNEERQNEGGLDLADKRQRWAFQVTTTPTSEKVNKTLEKISSEQIQQYGNIKVLVVGKKQKSYTGLKDALCQKVNGFKPNDIWDNNTLARKVVALDIVRLQRLYELVSKNAARIRIELELPDEQGNYKTSGYDQWEALVKPKLGDGKAFRAFCEQAGGFSMPKDDWKSLQKAMALLVKKLSTLPRVTREFLVVLLERKEEGGSKRRAGTFDARVSLLKAKRMHLGPDFEGEVAILEDAGLVWVDGDDPFEYGPPEIFVRISKDDNLAGCFFDFIDEHDLSLRRVVGSVDLSSF